MAGNAGMAAPAARMAAWRAVDLATVKLEEGSDGFTRSWIMLVPEGEFDHPQWGKLDLSKKVLDQFVRNFDERARGIDVAMDYDHRASEGDSRAPGWIEDMQYRPASANAPAGLWARIRWTPIGLADVKNQIYRYVSAEFKDDYKDSVSGKAFRNVILGATLTNRPFMKQMPAIQLSQRFQRPGQYTKSDRAKIPAEDFAGPNRTYPIVTQQDVHDAARLIGHAANPAAVKARIIAIARRKGFALPDAWASAKAGEAAVGTRRKKLAEEEQEPAADEQEFVEEAEADEVNDDTEADEADETDEMDEEEEDDELDDDAQLAEKSSGSAKGKKPFPGAAKPFGKSGKRVQPADDDAEDEADGGADEDAEEMDDATSDDEAYDDGEDTGDEEEAPPTKKRGGDRGKAMKAGTSRKMTEPQMLSEIARLTEENKTLREEQFKLNVNRKLSEMTRNIRRDGEDEEFALPRSIKLAYQEFMFEFGIRLSETALAKLDELVEKALRMGTVPMTSFANQVERGKLSDMDDRRPRTSANDIDMTPEAERIALSEHKMPLERLREQNPEAVMNIYLGLEARRKRGGHPAA